MTIKTFTSTWMCAFLILLSALGPVKSSASAADSTNCRGCRGILENIVYDPKFPDSCSEDIYLPNREDGPAPVVILIHGGSFITGSKRDPDMLEFAARLVDQGYVVCSLNYRLIQNGGAYPYNIEDIQAAIVHLSAHCPEYHADPDNMLLVGTSAGGYLALMAAYSEKPCKKLLKAVVAICPATDLSQLVGQIVNQYVNSDIRSNNKKFKKASPLNYAKVGIPTLLIHGESDQLITIDHSRRLERALKAAGVPVMFVAEKNCGHDFILRPGKQHDAAVQTSLAYLKSQVLNQEPVR